MHTVLAYFSLVFDSFDSLRFIILLWVRFRPEALNEVGDLCRRALKAGHGHLRLTLGLSGNLQECSGIAGRCLFAKVQAGSRRTVSGPALMHSEELGMKATSQHRY